MKVERNVDLRLQIFFDDIFYDVVVVLNFIYAFYSWGG